MKINKYRNDTSLSCKFSLAKVWEMHVLLPDLCLSKRLGYNRSRGYLSSEDVTWSSGRFPGYDRTVGTGLSLKAVPTQTMLRFCEDVEILSTNSKWNTTAFRAGHNWNLQICIPKSFPI